MRRRTLLFLIGGTLATPAALLAQRSRPPVVRIGFLGMPRADGWTEKVEAFRAGLRSYGYTEGKDLVIEYRWAEGKYDRLPELARDLAQSGVDVIVTHATAGVGAAKQATTTTPIVIAATGDAVGAGLVASLARPGGNITGSSFLGPVIAAKRLDLLREAMPSARRVGLVFNPRSAKTREGVLLMVDAVDAAARARGLELVRAAVEKSADLDRALAQLSGSGGVDALLINEDPFLVANASAIVSRTRQRGYPAIGFPEIAGAGGLIGFGASIVEMHRRAAYFVDRILKGTPPSELPVEQPTRFELLVNLGAARALGLALPQSLLLRADRVIE